MVEANWWFWAPFLAGIGVGAVVAFITTVIAMLILYGIQSELLGRNIIEGAEADLHGLIKRCVQRMHLSIHVHDDDNDPANWWRLSEKNDDGDEDDFGGYNQEKKPRRK